MAIKKPSPVRRTNCEYCLLRNGDFFEDERYDTIRCMCRARHSEVDVNLMSGCDFFQSDPNYEPPKKSQVIKPKRLSTKKPKRKQ